MRNFIIQHRRIIYALYINETRIFRHNMFWNPPKIVHKQELIKEETHSTCNINSKYHFDLHQDIFHQMEFFQRLFRAEKEKYMSSECNHMNQMILNKIQVFKRNIQEFIDSTQSSILVIHDVQQSMNRIAKFCSEINSDIADYMKLKDATNDEHVEEEPVASEVENFEHECQEYHESDSEHSHVEEHDAEIELMKTLHDYESEHTACHDDAPESEDNMHVILHELISAIGQLDPPGNHDLLDLLVNKLPKTSYVHYPTRNECPDAFDRQSRVLCQMTRLYEGVSRLSMDTNQSPTAIYNDEMMLKKLMKQTHCAPNEPFGFLFGASP